MFRTFGETLRDIEVFYENKDYNNVVVETAKLMEQALGYLFKNFHRTLKKTEERLAFLEFERQNDEKYSVFIKKPTIGVALGFYNSLLKHIPDHKWLHEDLKSAINKVNVIRNAQVHAGKKDVSDSEAGEVIDSAELFLKKTEIYDLPLEDIGFPLKYYLVYTSIQDKFKKGESESDFRKIIGDASKIIPKLLNAIFNKVYPFLPIEHKEKLNVLYPKTMEAESKELSIKYFIEIFNEIELFTQISDGDNLKTSLKYLAEKEKESFSRRSTRHHVTILEIIFEYIHNNKLDHFLDYANLVKKKYLEDNQLNETDRIILADRAKEFGISDTVSGTIEKAVVRTIEKELILFQTLHEEKTGKSTTEIHHSKKKKAGEVEPKLKKSYLYAGVGAAFLIVFTVIYFTWIKSDFPAYERAFLKGQQDKYVDKAEKARTLKNVRAHGLYIWGSFERNNSFMPDEIISEYQDLLIQHPESPEAHFYLGEVYSFAANNRIGQELRDSAWILINKAIDMGLKAFDPDNMRMSICGNLGIISLVIESADEFVKDYPENPDAWTLAGTIYNTYAFDTAKAIEHYKKAIDIYPKAINAIHNLADLYIAQDKFELASEMLDKSMKIYPDNSYIAQSYKSLFLQSGRLHEAVSFFEDIIEKYNLKQENYYRALADFYIMQSDTTRAKEFIESSLEKYPEDPGLKSSMDDLKRITRIELELSEQKANQQVIWLEDIEIALAQAEKENKPILAEFCNNKQNYYFQKMNLDIYPDPVVQDELTKFILVRLFENNDPEIFKLYDIDYPYFNLLLISSDGVKIGDVESYSEHPSGLLAELKKGIIKYRQYETGKRLNTETYTEVSNFEDAKLISKAKGFPIMMLASNENSTHSKKLLEESFNDPIFKSEFNNVVYIETSPERNPDLMETWNIRIFPSILFFDDNGELIYRTYGYKIPENLSMTVRKVKETYAGNGLFEPEVNWLFTLEEARNAALAEQKNIFMCSKYFRNDTNRMKDQEVIRELGNFICLSIEEPRNADVVSKYGGLYYYTCLILDPSGNEMFKSYLINEKEKLLKWLDIEGKVKQMLLLGSEQYKKYRNQVDLADAMSYFMPRSSIAVYKEQLETFPDDLEIIRGIGEQYLYLKNAEEAIKYFHKEVEISEEYTDELLDNIVEAYLQLGKDKELKEWFDDQIQANENNNKTLIKLYGFYSGFSEILMESKKAREYALTAITLDPDNYRSYYQLGKLLYYSGDYEEAKKHLRMATKVEDLSAVALLYIALIADALGEEDEKQRNIEIALGRFPYAYNALRNRYYNRSKFYEYPGYIALIIKGYQDAISINPNNIPLKASFARFLTNFGNDLDLALKLNSECIEKEPETWYLLDDRAWILYKMGKYNEADQTITRFIQNELERNIDRWIWSFYHIGKIKIAIGESELGMEYLGKTRKFRTVNPLDEFMVEDVKSILDSSN